MGSEMLHDGEITPSSGNVFADLGLPNPEDLLFKAQIALQIDRFIEEKGWTQAEAAQVIGVTQPEVSLLLRGRLGGFSLERLVMVLNRLGHDVEMLISEEERPPERTQLRVRLA